MKPSAKPPAYEPSLRTLAMPGDANPNGDIFGGWLMSQMDLAGGIHAYEIANGRVATVAVDAMSFDRPVHVGDALSIYCLTKNIGTTSIAIRIESWVRRAGHGGHEMVTAGLFTFVAIDDDGKPRKIEGGGTASTWGAPLPRRKPEEKQQDIFASKKSITKKSRRKKAADQKVVSGKASTRKVVSKKASSKKQSGKKASATRARRSSAN